MRKFLTGVIATVLLGIAAAAGYIWSGLYNIAADVPHYNLTHSALETLRMRSIAARADNIEVPNLQDAERIRRGAGNYDSMCVICHLAPGAAPTELHNGLYPQPPNLAKASEINPARAFWVIKHGIKASGMPAWGQSMDDSYIWDMVAFLIKMPAMSPEQYASVVAASEGHSHGGSETPARGHGPARDPAADPVHEQPPNAPQVAKEPPVHDQRGRAGGKDHHHRKDSRPHAH